MNHHLLIELGTEELPPKALKTLSEAFAEAVLDYLKDAEIPLSGGYAAFATPRRLAVLVYDVAGKQNDREIERRGPAESAAFNADGLATPAAEGFARSCGVSVEQLDRMTTDKGEWLAFRESRKGRSLGELLPEIVERALARLPVPKRMRWGDHDVEFVRPVHWIVLMHGADVIPAQIMDIDSSNRTMGHRFHANHGIALADAAGYADRLKTEGFVLAGMGERRQVIYDQVVAAAAAIGGRAVIDEDLLDEVTALNEWPVAVAGAFDAEFLEVPPEALIRTMQDNQKYFPVVDDEGGLINHFITISNIDSRSPEKVKAGNERVIRPRLADAKFFWEQDRRQPLEAFRESLDSVVFQARLGTIGDKTGRVMELAGVVAKSIGADVQHATRAALLCKCDLQTDMVGEFASLQGVMGKRYALVGGEPEAVAIALQEQYLPKGAGDETAATPTGQVLAISDKLDTLVGIFAIGQRPSGEKDPYALRRAALGILRTVIERELDLDLRELIAAAAGLLADKVDASAIEDEVFEFMLERLKAYYLDRGVPVDVFDAVCVLKPARPLDFDRRIRAVAAFRALPEAESLSAANKRVGNILKKTEVGESETVNAGLFEVQQEETLYNELESLNSRTGPMFDTGEYESALRELSALRGPVDDFFDNVMVLADDERLRNNRIALLLRMRTLFLRAADLSRLHQK